MHDYTTKIETKQFWNRKMIETFIKLYKENECLYNKKHPDYKDKTTQILALRSILHKMKQFLPNLKLKDLIEKLKAIRTQFSKELVLVDRAKAMGNTYVPKMWCFNQMEFLRLHLKSLSGDKSIIIDSDAELSNSDFSSDLNLSKTSTEYRWEREDLKIFINLLKKYPILYNHRHEHFQNKTMKSKARALLLKEAQRIDPKINITIMNYKIRTMIKQYRQELARKKEAQKNNKKYTSRFWCFDLLSFLNSPNGDGTITNNELSDDNNITEIDHTDYEMNNVNNETFEIEPIHHVIIENETEYAEKLEIEPIEDSKYNHHHQNVIDYEYEENTFDMINTENYEYKDEPLHKTETEFIEETIEFSHPEFTTKMESNMDKSKNNYNIKYEWLGKLVVSQLDIISPKYHNELASDVQSLIRDYIAKSKENLSGQSTDTCKKKKNNRDPSSSSSSNVSFNVRFV